MTEKAPRKSKRHQQMFERALALRDAGDRSSAIEILSELLSEDPSDADTLLVLGALLFHVDRYSEAVDVFRKVLDQLPKNELASLGLFHSLWSLGQWREASAEVQRFLSVSQSREYERLLEDINRGFEGMEEDED